MSSFQNQTQNYIPRYVSDEGIWTVLAADLAIFVASLIFFICIKDRAKFAYYFRPQAGRKPSDFYPSGIRERREIRNKQQEQMSQSKIPRPENLDTPNLNEVHVDDDNHIIDIDSNPIGGRESNDIPENPGSTSNAASSQPSTSNHFSRLSPGPNTISGAWRWLWTTIRIPHSTIFRIYGIDTWAYLQFLQFCIIVFFLLTIIGLVVYLPTNMTGGNHMHGFNGTCMGNLPPGDDRAYVHLVGSYVITFTIAILSFKFFKQFTRFRQRYKKLALLSNFSCMVRNVPLNKGVTTSKKLEDFFEKLYPNQVASATLVFNLKPLEKKIRERQEFINELDRCIHIYQTTGIRPTHSLSPIAKNMERKQRRLLGVEYDRSLDSRSPKTENQESNYQHAVSRFNGSGIKLDQHKVLVPKSTHEMEIGGYGTGESSIVRAPSVQQIPSSSQQPGSQENLSKNNPSLSTRSESLNSIPIYTNDRLERPPRLHKISSDSQVGRNTGSSFDSENLLITPSSSNFSTPSSNFYEVDSINWYQQQIDDLDDEIDFERRLVEESEDLQENVPLEISEPPDITPKLVKRTKSVLWRISKKIQPDREEDEEILNEPFEQSDIPPEDDQPSFTNNSQNNSPKYLPRSPNQDPSPSSSTTPSLASSSHLPITPTRRSSFIRTPSKRHMKRSSLKNKSGNDSLQNSVDMEELSNSPVHPSLIRAYSKPSTSFSDVNTVELDDALDEQDLQYEEEEENETICERLMINIPGWAWIKKMYRAWISGAQSSIIDADGTVRESVYTPTTVGFVTFKTLVAANHCAHSEYLSKSFFKWRVDFAPPESDIIWRNIRLGWWQSWIRYFIMVVIVGVLIIFWGVPVGFMAQWANVDHLETISWLHDPIVYLKSFGPTAVSILTRLSPTVTLLLFMNILVPILRLLFEYVERPATRSGQELAVFRTYYAFLLFNVLFLSTLTSQISNLITEAIRNPSNTVTQLARHLGETLPVYGAFFINYILNATFISGALGLPRLVMFLIHFIQLKWAKTPREIEQVKREAVGGFEYDSQFAAHLNIFTIALAYSSMVPLILPTALLYYLVWFAVDKYNLVFAYYDQFDRAGVWTPLVYRRIFAALTIYHFTMFGTFLVKQNYIASGLTLPMFVFDLMVHWYAINTFAQRSQFVPLDEATRYPHTAHQLGLDQGYVHPAMHDGPGSMTSPHIPNIPQHTRRPTTARTQRTQ